MSVNSFRLFFWVKREILFPTLKIYKEQIHFWKPVEKPMVFSDADLIVVAWKA